MHKNNVHLVGSDPEAHQTSNGTTVTNLSLATKTSWKKEDARYDSRTEWHRVVLGAS